MKDLEQRAREVIKAITGRIPLVDDDDHKYAHAVITQALTDVRGQHGKTVDGCSAAAIRAILSTIAAAIRRQEE
jgi:hypothetical protein